MAWNEPGGGGKDPWSGKGGDQGPPDLDEVVRKLQDKFGGVIGKGRRRSGGGDGGGGPSLPQLSSIGGGALVAIALVVWALFGIYIVEPAERGVVLRFGSYLETTEPGPHWRPALIDSVVKVNVDQISSFTHKAQMLTQDENIVDVELTVQSRVQDAVDFLFQDRNPEGTLRDTTETVVREVVGKSRLDFIITEGRSAIADNIKVGVQGLLNGYRTGLEVTSVNINEAKPPEPVKPAFDDAIKAREDKERLENKAEAYANEVVPQARGNAARQVADARAYKERVIAEAEGEGRRFLSVLTEYEKAPKVTRERLYLETVESVMQDSNKVILDVQKGGNSLMYLPLDKLIQERSSVPPRSMTGSGTENGFTVQSDSVSDTRDASRSRRVR